MNLAKRLTENRMLLVTSLWIGVIFAFSMQGGDSSSSQSGFVVALVIQIFKWVHLPTEGYNLPFYVRKLAHFTEYFILGLLAAASPKEKAVHPAWFLWVPILDESIQYFTPGRVMSPIDMAIDACGYLAGYALARWILRSFAPLSPKH